VVLDCDTEDRFGDLAFIIEEKLNIDSILNWTLLSGTGKGIHIWLIDDLPPTTKFLKLDIKSEGGYIVAPPSLHPSGKLYKFINPGTPIRRIKNLIDIGIDVNQKKQEPERSGGYDNWITKALQGVGEGDRNDICDRLACHFKNSQPIDITESLLIDWNKLTKPPLPESEVLTTIKSAYGRQVTNADNKDNIRIYPLESDLESERIKSASKSVSDEGENVTSVSKEIIEERIKDTSGWFSYDEVDRELGIKSSDDKTRRRIIFKRLRDDGIIKAHQTNNKLFRYVQDNFSIYYQTSEMGDSELASRLEKFENIELDEWNFTAEERSRDFADVRW
jgi:hypothetical protein